MTIKQLKKLLTKMTEEETYSKARMLCYDKSNGELFTPDEVYCNERGDVVIAGYEEDYV